MLCPMCQQAWCGRPCINDPHKSNALLFHPDGRAKTLKERGLGWDDPPPVPVALAPRKRSKVEVVSLLKGKFRDTVPKIAQDVPKMPVSVPKIEAPVPKLKRGRGRPASGLSAAERKRRQRAAKAEKKL